MNNTIWNQQPPENNRPAGNNGNPRAGRSLREYAQQQQIPQQYPPAMPRPQGPAQFSPMPPPQPSQRQGGPLPGQRGWVANTMQTVRRWSGHMAAVPGKVDQQPLVLYRPGQRIAPVKQKVKPWKRSRTMRISMQMRLRRERWQRNQLNPTNLAKNIAIALALVLVILSSSGVASAYAYYQSEFPRLQGIANQQISQTSHIYDRNGVLLYDLFDPNGGGRRTPVSYNDIPQIMRDSMIAAEDHTFWDNPGIDPQGIGRAAIEYLQYHQVAGGGSTLTQQLIKNLTNNRAVTLDRKITEAVLAIGLTQQFPKWKILEIYFNVSPFGAQELGVEAAVEDYFHIMPQCNVQHVCTPAIANLDLDLNTHKHNPLLGLARASLLAGMPQNPSSYDPTLGPANKARALVRQDEVLGEMLAQQTQVPGLGTITPAMIQQAEALTAKMTFTPYIRHIRAPHFVLWVIQQLEDQLGVETLLNSGFNIRTTIDINLEEFVENAVRRHLDKPEYQPFEGDYGPLNAVHNVNDSAVVVMSAKTGEILAMDGSADWNSNDPKVGGKYNAAVAYRSPGSSFKPIVYATAFQMGWYPGLALPDRKTFYPFPSGAAPLNVNDPEKTAYHPPDYGGGYHNLNSTIRIDIANSFNVPAVKTFEFAGVDNVANMARRLGITAIDNDVAKHNTFLGPATALGTAGVPLIQMVGAYQVFANQGVHIPPKTILDIWDNYGHNLYHFDPTHPNGVQVISPQIAYLMTSILSDEPARAIEFTGDHVLSMYDWEQADGQKHELAAKTGTTDDFVDNWTIGYTPDVVVGVWSGNADNSPLYHAVGITGAGPIWHSVIERASGACNTDGAGIPCGNYHPPYPFTQTTFTVPPGVIKQAISKSNGLEGTGITDWMLDTEKPMQTGIPIPCDLTTTAAPTQVPVATTTPGITFCTGPAPGTDTGPGTPTPTTVPGPELTPIPTQ